MPIIEAITRLTNTPSGNPRFRLEFEGGDRRETEPDAQYASVVADLSAGDLVNVELNGAGRLAHVERIER